MRRRRRRHPGRHYWRRTRPRSSKNEVYCFVCEKVSSSQELRCSVHAGLLDRRTRKQSKLAPPRARTTTNSLLTPSGIGRSCLGIQFLPGGGDLSRTVITLYLSRRDRLRSPPPELRHGAGLRRAKITSQHICDTYACRGILCVIGYPA